MFSYEFCEFLRNTYFEKDLRTAGSDIPVQWSYLIKVQARQDEGI